MMDWMVPFAVALVAFLYSSVGHAGASGYIAVMTLASFPHDDVKPTALVLNLLVSFMATVQFYRAGFFSWALLWPFAISAIPCAFLGGYLTLPGNVYRVLLGVVLGWAALRLVVSASSVEGSVAEPSKPAALGLGALIGLLAGLTGTGGGIFLTPLLLFMNWAGAKTAAAASAAFILCNSLSGLSGHLLAGKAVPAVAWSMVIAAGLGGAVGSLMGARRFPPRAIRHLLALVLAIAAGKLLTT